MPQYLISIIKDALTNLKWSFSINGQEYDANVVSDGESLIVRMSHKVEKDFSMDSYDIIVDEIPIATIIKTATVPAGDILTLSYVIHVK